MQTDILAVFKHIKLAAQRNLWLMWNRMVKMSEELVYSPSSESRLQYYVDHLR